MFKGKRILLYVIFFIVIFVIIFILANSPYPLGITRLEENNIYHGVNMLSIPGEGTSYKTNPVFYFSTKIYRVWDVPYTKPTWYPYIFYWLFLSLIITSLFIYLIDFLLKDDKKKYLK